MTKVIHCKKCGEPIVNKKDLVTATVMYDVYPFHSYCYVRDFKGARTLVLSNTPLNGFASNFKIVSICIIAVFWVFLADASLKWGAFVAVPFIIYRLYAYLAFERHIKDL